MVEGTSSESSTASFASGESNESETPRFFSASSMLMELESVSIGFFKASANTADNL
jgi:hypothetical protein